MRVLPLVAVGPLRARDLAADDAAGFTKPPFAEDVRLCVCWVDCSCSCSVSVPWSSSALNGSPSLVDVSVAELYEVRKGRVAKEDVAREDDEEEEGAASREAVMSGLPTRGVAMGSSSSFCVMLRIVARYRLCSCSELISSGA